VVDALRRTIETQGAQIGAEMTVMRRGLEAAFDQLEKIEPAQDYKPQLAQLVQALDNVAERMHGVEQSPILKQGAQHYAAVLERSGEGLIRTAALELENKARDLECAGRNLSAYVDSARERVRQDWWLAGAGIIGLAVGVLLTLLVPRVLPFSVDTHVAGLVMGESRWSAGLTMMQAYNEGRFNDFLYADELVQTNRDTIAACYQAARNGNAAESCTITVAVPTREQ
jgi:hypothetical protein